MKIQEFTLNNYGPIKRFLLKPGSFECIYGLNESGKTAAIEALSYLLFKKRNLRYGKPQDYTIKIADNDKVYTLSHKQRKFKFPVQIIPSLLYIKASESSIYEDKKEETFWDTLKTLFSSTGRKMVFKDLIEKTFAAAELQPKQLQWEKHKQAKIKNIEERCAELKSYIEKIDEIEKMRSELTTAERTKENLQRQLTLIDDYKNYQRYEELTKLYNTYVDKKVHLQEYDRYQAQFLKKWQNLEAKKESLVNSAQRRKEIKNEIEQMEREIIELEKKEEIIKIEEFSARIEKLKDENKGPALKYALFSLAASIILFILSFIFKIPKLLSIMILIISSLFVMWSLRIKQRKKKLDDKKNELLKKAKIIFPQLSTIKELKQQIEHTKQILLTKRSLLEDKKKTVKSLASEETIEYLEKEIADLRNKTGLAELSALEEKLNTKGKLQEELQTLRIKIADRLSEDNDRQWQRMITAMKTAPPEEIPDLKKEKELQKKLAETKVKIDELNKTITIFDEVQRSRYNITNPHEVLMEYQRFKQALQDYILEKKAALAARDIFEKMSNEMEAYIQTLFADDTSLNKYFRMITERYKQVKLEGKKFIVTDRIGKKYKIDDLSSGAKDQLLICFRIAVLEKLYPDGIFLFFDDAFLFADWPRRKRLTELLKNFSAQGNQVLYFTSDNHTRDLFHTFGARITEI